MSGVVTAEPASLVRPLPDHNHNPNFTKTMSTLLEYKSETPQQIFTTLAESLEDGERLPTETLIAYLRHREEAIRKLTVELLEYNNDPIAVPALLEAAADDNIEVSIAASEILRSFRNPQAVDYLIEGLSDPKPETRLAAVVALRDRGAPAAVAGLVRSLGDPEPEVRREAIIALSHYRRGDLLLALRSGLRDESPAVRKAAVAAVAEFDSAFVFDDLITALSDDNWQVRREAAVALRHFSGQASEAALRDALSDTSWQVAREAAFSLSRLQPSENEHVAGLLVHELADLRIAAVIALGESGNSAWVDRLEPLLNDSDSGVQKSARRAIERLAAARPRALQSA